MVNKVAQRAIAAGLAGMMSFGAVAPAAMALDTHTWSSWWNWNDTTSDEGLDFWRRIAGDDRYGTMKKIVEASYKIGGDDWWRASVAVVASGDNFPDALAANGLAGALNNGDGAPVILTKKGALSSQAKELLQKMSVQTVYIMGGTAAVSEATESAIRNLNIATVRVAGADRQATSVAAFKLIDGNWYKNHGTHSVIIATGANYADALSIAPFAYRTGTPVVLTKADGTLTDEAVKAIKANDQIYQLIVVGGNAAVSDSVFSVLGTYNGSYRDYYNKVYVPVRIAGADRYDTSAKVADWEINYALDVASLDNNTKNTIWNTAGFSYYETFVATGENFPDALAGGQLAGGKWYANSTKTAVVTGTRWADKTYITPTLKAGSPILLTKDGDRSADSVIAKGLAWNPTTRSVDSYEFTNGTLTNYLDVYLLRLISPDVYTNGADGFFTDVSLTDQTNKKFAELANVPMGRWIDGYRVEDNNFRGVILGGKAAVSKDTAKRLDDTVRDSIYTVNDPVATYWDNDSYITVAGKTYHTLGWLSKNTWNWWNNTTVALGVSDFGATYKPSVDDVVAVPYGSIGYQYLYQPYNFTQDTYKVWENGSVKEQSYTISLAKFTSDPTVFGTTTNSYTGYKVAGKVELKVMYKYDTAGVLDPTTSNIEWSVVNFY